jgi:hypothetical protein
MTYTVDSHVCYSVTQRLLAEFFVRKSFE